MPKIIAVGGAGSNFVNRLLKKSPEHDVVVLPDTNDMVMKIAGDEEDLAVVAGFGGSSSIHLLPKILSVLQDNRKQILLLGYFPFMNEGPERIKKAKDAMQKCSDMVSEMCVINNQVLLERFGGLALSEAFQRATMNCQ